MDWCARWKADPQAAKFHLLPNTKGRHHIARNICATTVSQPPICRPLPKSMRKLDQCLCRRLLLHSMSRPPSNHQPHLQRIESMFLSPSVRHPDGKNQRDRVYLRFQIQLLYSDTKPPSSRLCRTTHD